MSARIRFDAIIFLIKKYFNTYCAIKYKPIKVKCQIVRTIKLPDLTEMWYTDYFKAIWSDGKLVYWN